VADRFRTRRRHRRLTLRIAVEYTTRSGVRRAEATTLGAGGLFIASDDPLPKGAPLIVAFVLPGGSHRHEIPGRVVWSQRDDGHSRPGMGIAFKDPAASSVLASELEQS
jgi:uncharacterized protein (TIGR02266 family)